jgi:hypothetical protein
MAGSTDEHPRHVDAHQPLVHACFRPDVAGCDS